MTKAALNALAFAYLVGRMPKYLHLKTWTAVYACGQGNAHPFAIREECRELAEAHPMTRRVRELEADGWRIDRLAKHDKVRDGIELIRDLDGGKRQETCVYPTGKQGRIYGA